VTQKHERGAFALSAKLLEDSAESRSVVRASLFDVTKKRKAERGRAAAVQPLGDCYFHPLNVSARRDSNNKTRNMAAGCCKSRVAVTRAPAGVQFNAVKQLCDAELELRVAEDLYTEHQVKHLERMAS
jgi:hypothetical protein